MLPKTQQGFIFIISALRINYCYFFISLFCILRVDLNVSIKVGDFGFTREASYLVSHIQKCPVKWMPPEMLQDGISTEKSDVVGWCLLSDIRKTKIFPMHK